MDEDEGETVDVTSAKPNGDDDDVQIIDADDKKSSKRSSKDSGTFKKRESFSAKQQHLFLMEFLVDTVTIDSCSVDEEVLEGQTCLTLTFLNFPPMEICEKDFDPSKKKGKDKVKFNCGKSLMFAFNEKQCEHPPPLSVEITVSKKLGDDENPYKVDIGTIKICVAELFRQIVDIARFKPDRLPASKAIKDCFMLIGPAKRTMGEISVCIRFSCLGQNVVTEFQCGSDMKSPVLFKNREGKKAYEFTGAEPPAEGEASAAESKTGCGCISAQQRGGQGDTGTSPKANNKENRVVVKRNRYQGGRKGSNKVATVSQVNTNPDENCFVLRVGDKGEIPDRGKMILEFRTPKQKILPKELPPYHEDIAVQTDQPKKGKGKKKK